MTRRELSVAAAMVALAAVLAVEAPSYFAFDNLRDIFLSNAPVLIVAIGMLLVMLTGEIDISVGSLFAVCGVIAGVAGEIRSAVRRRSPRRRARGRRARHGQWRPGGVRENPVDRRDARDDGRVAGWTAMGDAGAMGLRPSGKLPVARIVAKRAYLAARERGRRAARRVVLDFGLAEPWPGRLRDRIESRGGAIGRSRPVAGS